MASASNVCFAPLRTSPFCRRVSGRTASFDAIGHGASASKNTRRRAAAIAHAARDGSSTAPPAEGASDAAFAPPSAVTPASRDLGPRAPAFQVAAKASVAAPAKPAPAAPAFPPALAAALGVAAAAAAAGAALSHASGAQSPLAKSRARMALEAAPAFGGGDKKFPIIRRYAENVSARYATVLPRALETVVFAEIIKTAALGAFASLYENVRSADALGHPAALTNDVDWNYAPAPPEVDAEDVERFVLDVLNTEEEHVGLIPRAVETELIRNAFIAGIYVAEDALKSFSARLFGFTYSLTISEAEKGWRLSGTNAELSDEALRRLVRDELKTPPVSRLFPQLEKDVAKVAWALASETVGTAEFVFLGLPLEFRLRAKEAAVAETVIEAAAREAASEENVAASEVAASSETKKKNTSETESETDRVIAAYVDAYMRSRGNGDFRGGPASLFFSRSLERDTYVGFLKQIFGTIDGATVADVMGFDIIVRVGEVDASRSGALRQIDPAAFRERLAATSTKKARREIEAFVDWLMADPVYNIKAVPDAVERQVYINIFELLASLVSVALSTFEVRLLGRRVAMKAAECAPEEAQTDFAGEKRFKPDPSVIQKFAESVTPVKPAQEVMCNVFSFALAFVAFEIRSIEAVMVGRKLGVTLARPLEGGASAQTFDVEESLDVEFNAALRRALVVLAQEMLVASPGAVSGDALEEMSEAAPAAPETGAGTAAGTKRRAARREDAKENGNPFDFKRVMAGARDVLASFGAFGSVDADDDDKITGKARVRPGEALEDMVYATFIAHHSEPDAKFPFAYLTPGAFDEAVTELVAALRPGEKVPRSATAAIAAAADANGDGVIQWQEYLFCANELDQVLKRAETEAVATGVAKD